MEVRYSDSLPDSENTSLTRPEEILASRRWETAPFTTYALSISFFESVILRELQKGGCRDVWVLTDVEGYAASLIERRATKVGRDYRLIPIRAPNGVFHPKCAYLSGSRGDLLLVGSGNLTFGGYGRNVEALDVLAPERHPGRSAILPTCLRRLAHGQIWRCPKQPGSPCSLIWHDERVIRLPQRTQIRQYGCCIP